MALSSMGLQSPDAQAMAQGQFARGQQDLRNAVGAATPNNTTGSQLEGDQGILPPEGMAPGATPQASPFAQAPANGPSAPLAQTMIKEGKASNRILTQQQLGRR